MPYAVNVGEHPYKGEGPEGLAEILVIGPTSRELGGLKDGEACHTAVVGIGHEAAPSLTSLLPKQRPALVLSLGFAGALQTGLQTGTLTLPATVVTPDNTLPPLTYDAGLLGIARDALAANGLTFDEGPLLTVQRVLLTPDAKYAHGKASRASTVDMEGYWLAQAAAEAAIPMVAMRVVLDEVDQSLPPLVHAIIADGGRNEWRHAIRSLRKPPAAAALVPLAVRSWQANRSLRRATRAVAPALLEAVRRHTL